MERVFPRNPSNEWNKPDLLQPYLWHIGNPTMPGGRLHKDVANRGFAFERAHFGKHSEVEMAKWIAKEYRKRDEQAIRDHAIKLGPLITEVWDFTDPSRV